jgi:hypothetical protein
MSAIIASMSWRFQASAKAASIANGEPFSFESIPILLRSNQFVLVAG